MSIPSQNSAEISHVLGVDFGQAKIGLALADMETKIAFAHKTLENKANIFQKLSEIVQNKKVEKIIVGMPIHKASDDTAKTVREFIHKLKEEIKIPVELQNEMFTTKMAEENLKESGAKKIKNFDDQEAARIILQSWLEENY
ncbi:MAG: Holliday junction resolvase RuvX [Candidatus Moranbacteria bacterium CG10_big_fil_rev_8_21_14_0_10_35_21]|nr:MAG: Holliday junction resolvase RuvX [Candidatus Moranbacteria bacterium CG10_big_fil_rev_8_21_14_0_10_35_21]PJA88791.1 MAG: Holliday junction resolvase RuvX [Candidatus Moranbacteria bacterium CG_4_9_14_3_um_filter_36_9]